MKDNKKLKINKLGLIVILLALYLIIMCFSYVYTLKVKTISVVGNETVSKEDIINSSKITFNAKVLQINKKKIVNNIKEISLIASANVRVSIFGNVKITVKEQGILFYNSFNKKYITEDKKEVDSVVSSLGTPTLINYVPSEIYTNLIDKLSKVDLSIIHLISEIEYSPDVKNDITIDANRFLLRMNDGNYVYINLANFDKLNKYREFYATIDENVKGIFNLDSSSSGVLFQSFKEE